MAILDIVILAAGKGTRMYSKLPKILHRLGGMPLLEYVLIAAQQLNPRKIHVVYGAGGDEVRDFCASKNMELELIEQTQQLGTGHAVSQVLPHLQDSAQILILYGDVPLITAATLTAFVNSVPANQLGLITAELPDPTGFGRIIRPVDKSLKCDEYITAIVEQADANAQQLNIKEINTGIMLIPAQVLKKYLPKLSQNNTQNEYYLTDIIALASADGIKIQGFKAVDNFEIFGVNNKAQLAALERHYQQRLAQALLHQGVTLLDPARIDIRGAVTVATDVVIDVNVILEGKVTIGENSIIGPNTSLKNVCIGDNVQIKANCVIEDAVIENNCVIGPFARIRPKTHIKSYAHVGNFVEVKNCTIGMASKANHLTYLGDAIIGADVNIGAGTITCNYDGANKHQTIIEDGVFIGSDTQLVAPVTIGKNATIGAGSTIVSNAPANKLTLSRSKQATLPGWQRPIKVKLDNIPVETLNSGILYAGDMQAGHMLAPYTSWLIGGPAEYFYQPANLDDLAIFLRTWKEESVLLLGAGTNILVPDQGIKGVVIYLKNRLDALKPIDALTLDVEAGVTCTKLVAYCLKQGLVEAAFLAGIPGTIGGAVKMNAGAYGDNIWNYITSVTTINRQGKVAIRKPAEFTVGYREVNGLQPDEWVVAVTLSFNRVADFTVGQQQVKTILQKRRAAQPVELPSCGSVFRNPPGYYAAQLIESCGLKGKQIGGACVSTKHANFIVNRGNATATDVKTLIGEIRSTVMQAHNVDLELEVIIL